MTQILNIISHFHQSLLLLLYVILSFFLIISTDSLIVKGIRASSLVVFGVVEKRMDDAVSYFNLRSANRELRKENTRLSYENLQLQDALLENLRLRKLLQFKYEVGYDLLPAKVIGYSPHDIVTGLLLSSEEIEKVHKNNAVMTADGLVGKIIEISNGYAIAQILPDPNSRVSAKIQRNRELGMIKSDGGNALLLDHVPNTVTVLTGDVVLTSGYSQIYPANLKIGVVAKVRKNSESLYQTVNVTPSVNFNNLEEVFIFQQQATDE